MSITLNTGAGGATLATDTVAGTPNVDYQIVKLGFSVAGTAPTQASASNPLPAGVYFSGTAASVNSGNLDPGTLRVVLATNQPSLANAIPVAQSGAWTVTANAGSGTFSVSGQLADAAAFTRGTTVTTPIAGVAETSAPSLTTGKAATLSLNLSGGLRVDGSGTTQPVSGTFWQTTQPISGAVTANQGGTWTVQPGNTANTTPWLASIVPTAGQGSSVNSQLLTASGVVSANIKASAGTIYSLDITNNNSTPVFVRLYDKVTAPTTADTPIWRGIVPGNSGAAGMVRVFSQGLKTANGIGIRVTGAIADNDATNANNVAANVEYS